MKFQRIHLIVCVFFLSSCTTNGKPHDPPDLRNYFAHLDYESPKVVREIFDVGTIISIVDKSEKVIWTDDECLQLNQNELVSPRIGVTLPTWTKTLTGNTKLKASTGEYFNQIGNLSGELQTSGVEKVELIFNQPHERFVSIGTLRSTLANLIEIDESCIEQTFAKDTYVVDRVLLADGLTIGFKTKKGRSVDISGNIASKIEGAMNIERLSDQSSAITTNQLRVVAYQLYDISKKDGVDSTNNSVSIIRLSPEKLHRLLR